MTKEAIRKAAEKAVAQNEDLQLWQATIILKDAGLLTYKEETMITEALCKARNGGKNEVA